ncbi:MAG: hypothetical protein ACYS9X_02175 [Planctomycetota bacterium]|jgi:hypothetical protein
MKRWHACFCLALATLTGAACVPVAQRVRLEPTPYEPGGRTAFTIRAGFSINSHSGEAKDFVESMGLEMGSGGGVGFELGARSGNSAVLAGYSSVSADAEDEMSILAQDLKMFTLKYERFLPVGGSGAVPAPDGVTKEFFFSLTGIPHATLLDDASDGWRGGMGLGVEVGFCHRVVFPYGPGLFEFLRYGIGFRTVKFDEFEITGLGSAKVDDSLNSVYFTFGFDQRF